MKTKVTFSSSLTQEDRDIVSPFSMDILTRAAEDSLNPNPVITSTRRPPERQASAMCTNLRNSVCKPEDKIKTYEQLVNEGKIISYKLPGALVCKVYLNNQKLENKEVVPLMVSEINRLAKEDKLVSLHCVPEEVYRAKNIIDISHKVENLPNPRDFVKALSKFPSITKIITPYNSDYKVPFVKVDPSEPAIHIEILQIPF